MIQALLVYNGWGILLVRLALGVIFLAHGHRKLKNLQGTKDWFESAGFKPGAFFGPLVGGVEFLGGLFLVLGLLTQIVSVILAVVMVTALTYNLRQKAPFFKGTELDLIILTSLLLLATLDNGYLALNTFFGLYW